MWWERAHSTWWMSITCPTNAAKIVRINLCSFYWSPLQGQACGQTLILCWDAGIARLLGITPASDRMGQQSLWTVRNNQPVVCWTVHSTRTILIADPSRHLDPSCHPNPRPHTGPPSVRKLCMVILNNSGSKMCKGSFTVISVKKKDVNGDKS